MPGPFHAGQPARVPVGARPTRPRGVLRVQTGLNHCGRPARTSCPTRDVGPAAAGPTSQTGGSKRSCQHDRRHHHEPHPILDPQHPRPGSRKSGRRRRNRCRRRGPGPDGCVRSDHEHAIPRRATFHVRAPAVIAGHRALPATRAGRPPSPPDHSTTRCTSRCMACPPTPALTQPTPDHSHTSTADTSRPGPTLPAGTRGRWDAQSAPATARTPDRAPLAGKRHQRLYAGAPVIRSPAYDLRNHRTFRRQSGGCCA